MGTKESSKPLILAAFLSPASHNAYYRPHPSRLNLADLVVASHACTDLHPILVSIERKLNDLSTWKFGLLFQAHVVVVVLVVVFVVVVVDISEQIPQ